MTLADLLADTRSEAIARLSAPYRSIPEHASRAVLLFGAGPLGRRTAAALTSAGRRPIAFADNNQALWGSSVEGIPVISPEFAAARHGSAAIFAVTIYNGSAARAQLHALGCSFILSAPELYHGLPTILLPFAALDDPAETLAATQKIKAADSLWADGASRTEFQNQLAWRLGHRANLSTHEPPSHCYFPQNLFQIPPHGTITDCGAYDGDSLRLLLANGANFEHFLAVEPDPQTHQHLQAFIATLPTAIASRVTTAQTALGAQPGRQHFQSEASVTSQLSDAGTATVEVQTLGHLLAHQTTTLIKMDIEGAEPAALAGAARIIARDKPILAISAYHHPSDLWAIPLLIHSIVPDHRLYLRRYAEDCWELICYALPPGAARTP